MIPAGELVTVPEPVPALLTVSVGCGDDVKFAVTVVLELSVTWQVPVPEQPPPDQPVKVEPAVGLAVRVTGVPEANCALQVEPQLIPAGELVTVPGSGPGLGDGQRRLRGEGVGEVRRHRRARVERHLAGARSPSSRRPTSR